MKSRKLAVPILNLVRHRLNPLNEFVISVPGSQWQLNEMYRNTEYESEHAHSLNRLTY